MAREKTRPRYAAARQTACILVTKREPVGITRGRAEAKNGIKYAGPGPAGGCADLKRKDHNLVRRDEKRKTQAYVVGATPEAAKELRLQQEKQSPFSQSRQWHRTEVGSPEQKAVLEQIHAGLEAVGNKLGRLEALQKKVDELGVIERKSPGPDVLDERLQQLDRIEQKLDAAENKLAQLETTIARELKRPDVIEQKLDAAESKLAQLETTIARELKHPDVMTKMRGELENADIETEKRGSRSGLIGWLTGQDRRTGD